jgi:hypothetical protein
LKKRTKKLLQIWCRARGSAAAKVKSFLVLFFKKELLFFYLPCCPGRVRRAPR